MSPDPSADRPKNREIENEEQRAGSPPRPATEPPGSESSTRSSKTATDPGSGQSKQP
jgi:hypothetical protein